MQYLTSLHRTMNFALNAFVCSAKFGALKDMHCSIIKDAVMHSSTQPLCTAVLNSCGLLF
jgi:hypothetical protein